MTTNDLANRDCIPCRGGVPPLKGQALQDLQQQLGKDWSLVDEHHLEKDFKFRNFREALDFANRVGAVADQQNHHPDIQIGWGRAKVLVWTHKINGLTESDFVFAAKADSAL